MTQYCNQIQTEGKVPVEMFVRSRYEQSEWRYGKSGWRQDTDCRFYTARRKIIQSEDAVWSGDTL